VSRANAVRFGALALLWGTGFLWIKIALRGFSPVQITLVRLALGCAVLTTIALSRRLRPPTGRVWGHLFVAALVANAIPYVLFGLGEQTVGSNVAGALNASTPLWTVAIAFLAGTDRVVSLRRGVGLAVGFLGTVLIFSPWATTGSVFSWGGLACLGAAVSYGISYVYMGRFLTGRGIPPLMLAACQLGAATVWLCLALPVGGLQPITWRADAVVSLAILGALGTGIAYVLNYRLIADEGPTVASTVSYLLPVVAILAGFLVLAEPITVGIGVGIALVLLGVSLSQQRARQLDTAQR
jgi:drug/metabolite transporter (DMT)-like permease